ncbi:MAG: hydrogenase maturation protease [Anaerolineae bacterium]|nr:hydrogenase maturation protease [Anaerolineae bacterium]
MGIHLQSPILVIGVGNEDRGDDAAGLLAARRIRGRELPRVRVAEQSGDGAELIDLWGQSQRVYLIDAMVTGAPPGTVQRFDIRAGALPAHLAQTSSHLFGVVQAIELGRVLGSLPPTMLVYGIEGKCFDHGAGLSAEVEQAVAALVEQVIHDIQSASLSPA